MILSFLMEDWRWQHYLVVDYNKHSIVCKHFISYEWKLLIYMFVYHYKIRASLNLDLGNSSILLKLAWCTKNFWELLPGLIFSHLMLIKEQWTLTFDLLLLDSGGPDLSAEGGARCTPLCHAARPCGYWDVRIQLSPADLIPQAIATSPAVKHNAGNRDKTHHFCLEVCSFLNRLNNPNITIIVLPHHAEARSLSLGARMADPQPSSPKLVLWQQWSEWNAFTF